MPIEPSLTIKRRINGPPAAVYAAWTEPEKIARWFGPGPDDEVLLAEADPRVGGDFRVVFRGPDGEEHDCRGVYREAVPGEKLSLTWYWRTMPERESLLTVSLKPDGGGTMLTLLHERFADQPARDAHESGWAGALDKLAALFA